jgi:septal ring factor EnvC (AmiA/AmiB activator)
MVVKYIIFILSIFEIVSSFKILPLNTMITRRSLIQSALLTPLPLILQKVNADEDDNNRPLTPEEMEEYNRLLEEAKRIKSIIDANIKAADEELSKTKQELRK